MICSKRLDDGKMYRMKIFHDNYPFQNSLCKQTLLKNSITNFSLYQRLAYVCSYVGAYQLLQMEVQSLLNNLKSKSVFLTFSLKIQTQNYISNHFFQLTCHVPHNIVNATTSAASFVNHFLVDGVIFRKRVQSEGSWPMKIY